MSDDWVYLNGEIVPREKAVISALDRGLLYGDGVFETMRAYSGRVFALDRHLKRLAEALAHLRIEIPENERNLAAAIKELLSRNQNNDAAVRITITRGMLDGPLGLPAGSQPTRLIHCRPLNLPGEAEYAGGVEAMVASNPFAKSPAIANRKTLNYLDNLIAKQEALDKGCFEALLANKQGQIVESASSNVFAVHDGVVLTSPPSLGSLPGITRAFCLEILSEEGVRFREVAPDLAALPQISELFITNSVIELLAVVKVGEKVIGEGLPGPVYRRLRKSFRKLVTHENAP